MLCTSGFMDDVTFGRSGPYGASGVATLGLSMMSMNALLLLFLKQLLLPRKFSYCATHSCERGICCDHYVRPSVCLSVTLVICPKRLFISSNFFTD